MKILIRTAALLCLFVSTNLLHAATINVSGTWNSDGWEAIPFNVAAPGTVEFTYLSGFGDPTFSLFDAGGAHIITNDDSDIGLYSHLTQSLGAGAYTLLVSYCCPSASYAITTGAPFSSTDGFNPGSYWVGGTGTLAGMEGAIASVTTSFPSGGSQPYELNITFDDRTGVTLGSSVPDGGSSLAMLGLALGGVAAVRRKLKSA